MSDNNGSDGLSPSRRSLLAGIAGSTAVGSVPIAGAASSSNSVPAESLSPQERRERLKAKKALQDEYESKDLREIVATATESIRKRLADNGTIETSSMSQFALDVEKAARAETSNFASIRNDVGFSTAYDEDVGKASAHLFVATQTDSEQVHLHVLPEVDETYAVTVDTTSTEADSQSVDVQAECEKCTVDCNHAVYGAIVFGVNPPTDCGDVTWECTREPTCDECSGQDKCSSGW